MLQIIDKKNCCGCAACVQICPQQCMMMHEDNEGFLYPQIDASLCVDCGMCEKVCPVLNQSIPRKPLKVYAAKNTDDKIRMLSSSGGVFTVLSEIVLEWDGVVFGARFNEKWEVIHDYTETVEGLSAFRGSKYVQSYIGNSYQKVKSFLQQGRWVLFSGTPCQIAGLKAFLKREHDNLLTVDMICHGVPSPFVWKRYLEETISLKNVVRKKMDLSFLSIDSDIASISFRNKRFGWKKFGFEIQFIKDKGILYESLDKNLFMQGFLQNLYLRPSCYACAVRSGKSGSDITIGDYWGIQNILPRIDDDKGINLVFLNTKKGISICDFLQIQSTETSYENALNDNPCIENSVSMPQKRTEFFQNWEEGNILPLINKLTKVRILLRLKGIIYFLLRRLLLLLKSV